jgi:hypothetical protein
MRFQEPAGHKIDDRDAQQQARHPYRPTHHEQQRIDQVELHFQRQGPQRAVRAEGLARDTLQRKQVHHERMQADRVDLVADRGEAEADRIERVGQEQRRDEHRVDTRKTAQQEVAGIE